MDFQTETSDLTPKAIRTRRKILDVALELFNTQGYEATTLRDISTGADCSLGIIYRYFDRKEEMVLALYEDMSAETNTEIANLPKIQIAERFYLTMQARLQQASVHRDSIAALFGTMMNADSATGLFGNATLDLRQKTYEAFQDLVRDAVDPPSEKQVEQFAMFLYALHFALIMLWLFDPSPNQQMSFALLGFVRDMLMMLRRISGLPMVNKSLSRLVEIIEPMMVNGATQ